jgi:hypothetical protein
MVQDKNSFGPKPTTGHAYRIETKEVEHKGEGFTTSAMVARRSGSDLPAIVRRAGR